MSRPKIMIQVPGQQMIEHFWVETGKIEGGVPRHLAQKGILDVHTRPRHGGKLLRHQGDPRMLMGSSALGPLCEILQCAAMVLTSFRGHLQDQGKASEQDLEGIVIRDLLPSVVWHPR